MNREHKNPQFDFLKTTSPLYEYYSTLVESYTRCILPGKNHLAKLEEQYSSKKQILDRVCLQFEKEKQDEKKRVAEEQKEQEEIGT
jgi:hypothetical protein